MNKRLFLLFAAAAVLPLCTLIARAQAAAPEETPQSNTGTVSTPAAPETGGRTKDLPGYIDLDMRKIVGNTEPEVQVFIEKPLLEMVAAAIKANASTPLDPIGGELTDIVPQIDLVRVEVYEAIAAPAGSSVPAAVERVTAMLGEKGWTPIVRIPGEGERIEFLMKLTDGHIAGLAGFVAEASELVFINIAGKVEPERMGKAIGTIGGKFMSGQVNAAGMNELVSMLSGEALPGGELLGARGAVASADAGTKLEELVGTYTVDVEGVPRPIEIALEDGGAGVAVYPPDGAPAIAFVQTGPDRFSDAQGLGYMFTVKRNTEGAVTELEGNRNGERLIAKRVAQP